MFAIPGSIHSPLAKGCHQLIRQGAKLVESAQDILEELRWPAASAPARPRPVDTPELSDARAQLLRAAGHDPASVDQLAERSGLAAAEVQSALLALEMDGLLGRLPDGRYQKMGD